MSRIGKQEIQIPKGVEVMKDGAVLKVAGPKGVLTKIFRDDVVIAIKNKIITLEVKRNDKFSKSLWGTYASHIKNMIKGVETPYQKKLILEGIGFKSEVKSARLPAQPGVGGGKEFNFALGFSHPVVVPIPEGITATAEKNNITITGIDKELVGSFTAVVRALKKSEPYKGKGIRYEDEVVRRKQGKKTA
ncbi:MAG: 50S ribosomal protein L6 [Parcubacteria group bacterium GW2011_GWF2_38_8]|nr:MAG: 50S ribosomal protein L6 [Parcubacteria group bacterium GW2011_GWF2_38_8]